MPSSLLDRASPPDDAALARVLGQAKRWWDAVLADLGAREDGLVPQWKVYGAKHGWQLKVSKGKRAVVYLIPHTGTFTAGLALGGRAVAALASSGLPSDLAEAIRSAKKATEGRPARVEVGSGKQVAVVRALIALKLDGPG
jgi:hypothetical protein